MAPYITIATYVQVCYLLSMDRRAKLVTIPHITVVVTNKATRMGKTHLLP